MRHPSRIFLALLSCLVCAPVLACPAAPAGTQSRANASDEAEPGARAKPAPASRATAGPAFIAAGAGEIPALVLAERERLGDQTPLVVYVGAHWCEPCQYFHGAVDSGELDAVFPGLRLLEFDLDEDRERLAAAGYSSRMIPLFVVPGPDGRAGPRRMEGGIKGAGAVENLRPRLAALLEAAEADRRALANR